MDIVYPSFAISIPPRNPCQQILSIFSKFFKKFYFFGFLVQKRKYSLSLILTLPDSRQALGLRTVMQTKFAVEHLVR